MKRLIVIFLLPLLTTHSIAGWNEGVNAYLAKDYKAAMNELMPLATKGNAAAQATIGEMYLDGLGVAQNYHKAMHWLKLAAAQGDSVAQYGLGQMYEQGRGAPQDYKEAIRLYRMSAAQGDANAQHNLSVLFREGRGVAKDRNEEIQWLRLAAQNGHPRALNDLAAMYWRGEGVEQSDVVAYALLCLVASRDSSIKSMAVSSRDKIRQLMSREDVRAGVELSLRMEKGNPISTLDSWIKSKPAR